MFGPLENTGKTVLIARNENQLPYNLKTFFDEIKNGDDVLKVDEYRADWCKVETKNGYTSLFLKDDLEFLSIENMKLPAVDYAPLFVDIAGWILVIAPCWRGEAV